MITDVILATGEARDIFQQKTTHIVLNHY